MTAALEIAKAVPGGSDWPPEFMVETLTGSLGFRAPQADGGGSTGWCGYTSFPWTWCPLPGVTDQQC